MAQGLAYWSSVGSNTGPCCAHRTLWRAAM